MSALASLRSSLVALVQRVGAFERRLAARLARVSDHGAYVPELDGLRFFAMVGVVGCHLVAAYRTSHPGLPEMPGLARIAVDMLGNGRHAIQLYFALSGMIIAWPFVRAYRDRGPPVSLGRYWLRRLTRIEPPYVVALLLQTVVLLCLGALPLAPIVLLHLATSATYTHFFAFHHPSMIIDVAWSLEVEIQFYLLAPWLARRFLASPHVALRRTRLAVAIALLVALHASLPPPFAMGVWRYILPGQLAYFLAGFLLADLYAEGNRRTGLVRGDVLAVVGWLVLLLAPSGQVGRVFGGGVAGRAAELSALLFSVLAITAGTLGGWAWRGICRLRWIAIGGGMCYTYYLYHGILLVPISRWLMRSGYWIAHPWANALVVVAVGIAAITPPCMVLFAVFERPFMTRHGPWGIWRDLYERTAVATQAAPTATKEASR